MLSEKHKEKYLFIGLHVRSTPLVWAPVKGHTKFLNKTNIHIPSCLGDHTFYEQQPSVSIRRV